jgi:GNAT superfamily N-acetyltransferase
VQLRTVRFEDVPAVLRLVARAIAAGCADVYDATQLAAVYSGYASTLFVEALGPYETIVASIGDEPAAFAQLDPAGGRLRALFVDGELQGLGIGRALLRELETRARSRGCARVYGAMSLNAVPFYERQGYTRLARPERLTTSGIPVPIVRMEKRLR